MIYQADAVDHMDLPCCVAVLLGSEWACVAFFTKYMELQAGFSFTGLLLCL